jgi:rhamnulokinase
MALKQYLAFDLGAESGRAVLGIFDGQKLSLTEKHRFPNPNGKLAGRLQWNLLQQWEELKTGLKKTAVDLKGKTLSGIGVDTWGVDFGLVGEDGQILGNPIMYRDAQTDGIMERTFKKVSREKIFQATGLQFAQFNTLYQLLALKERNSSALEYAKTLLFMPDLFHYLFSGVKKSELSIASTSQMYDPRNKRWATGLLQQLDLPAHLLGELVPSGTVLGNLLPDVAAECGIEAMPVIAPAGHDTASAVAAVPAEAGTDWCYISSGTWSLMGVEIDEPILSDKAIKYNYTNEMGVGPRVRFLKNIMGLWLVQECRRHFQRQGYDHSYSELTAMAARSSAFGPLVDPDYDPFLKPGEMADKIDRFCAESKQRGPGSRGEYIRTCLESLALKYRQTIEGMEDVLGRKIKVIHIVGGGTQNELLNQMTADACGRTVIAGPIEATAIGNILVQAMATGDVKSLDEARAIVRASFDVKQYEPANAKEWNSAYEKFQKIVGK